MLGHCKDKACFLSKDSTGGSGGHLVMLLIVLLSHTATIIRIASVLRVSKFCM